MTIEEIENLIIERDYYKKMYIECNNAFTETMLKDLEKRYEVYRTNTCLHCDNGEAAYCERLLSGVDSRKFKVTKEVIVCMMTKTVDI